MSTPVLTPGQYVTVPGSGFVCWCIRKITRSPVAHAFLYVGPQADGTDMVEAEPGGVRFGRTSDYPVRYVSGRVLDPAVAKAIAETGIAMASKDTDYNFLADFYLGLREGARLPVPQTLFRLASTGKHVECAQLVDYAYLVNGAHLFEDGRSPGAVSPGDLWRLDYH
jgi:hypothetical protein